MLLIIVSVLPEFTILVYIYFRDKYEKEPLTLLLKAFVAGVLSALVTLVALSLASNVHLPEGSVFTGALIKAFVWAAIPEELFKFLFLYLLIWNNRNFNEYYDGIVYAVFVSLGFACFENILYVTDQGMTVGIMRALLAVPAHALFGVAMGYHFSLARFNDTSTSEHLGKSIAYAIMLHGIYDFLIFLYVGTTGISTLLSLILVIAFFAFVVGLWRAGLRKISKHIQLSASRE